jgi:hypothetical protein
MHTQNSTHSSVLYTAHHRPFGTRISVLLLAAVTTQGACDVPLAEDGDAALGDDEVPFAADDETVLGDDIEASSANGQALARVWLHGFRRYLAGFPGGASEIELRLADAIEAEELGDDELCAFIERAAGTLDDAALDGEGFEALALDEPITDALVEHLMPVPPPVLAAEPQPPSLACTIPAFSTLGKYRVELEGIQSLKSPSDGEGVLGEWPYYTWSLFTPTARWSGRTTETPFIKSGMKVPLFAGNVAPSASGSISSDALVLFRVFEIDSDFYKSEALTAAKAASAAIAVQIDWNYVSTQGKLQPGLVELYDTLSRSGSGADDVYEVEQIGIAEKRLWQITNGCWYYQNSQFPFGLGSGDYYDKMAMRLYDSNAKWRTWVTFRRL